MNPKVIVKEITEELLNLLEIKAEISVEEFSNLLKVKLTNTSEASFLIGHKGENLKALQHILRLFVLKKVGSEKCSNIILDIEDYRKNEEEKLKKYVKDIAEMVKKSGHPEVLSPMSSYKRRLVHLAVSEISGVISESFGEEPERRIIIKPAPK